MTEPTRAACAGTPDLWESTNPTDHAQAKDICDNYCQARAWCQSWTAEWLASAHGGGTRGTWNGQFYGKRGKARGAA